MKKLLLTITAIAALAACSKSHIEYDEPAEIAFTPISHNVTKSMMTGGENKNEFDTKTTFNVWAFYNPSLTEHTNIDNWIDDYYANYSEDKVYLNDKTFHYENGHWAGKDAAYYWPKVGTLAFAGYHPSTANVEYKLTPATTEPVADAVNTMTFKYITNTWVDNTKEPAADATYSDKYSEDLMYFNLTKGTSGTNVTVTFKHALAWLTVNVIKAAQTPSDATITINKIKFTDVHTNGTGIVNNQDPIVWNLTNNTDDIIVNNGDVVLSTTSQTLKEPLFIPQDMDGNLEITYTITSTDDSFFTETKVFTLADVNPTSDDTWVAGKHYIYNISIGTTEILIDPKITAWDDVVNTIEF